MPKQFSLGVLLIHGFGSQRRADTVSVWGEALLDAIREYTQPGVQASFTRGQGALTPPDQAAHVELAINDGSGTEYWLLAEAWWAEAFRGPSYLQVMSWGFRALPWAMALHIAQWYWRREAAESPPGALAQTAKYIAALVVAMLTAPVLVAVLVVIMVLGLVPVAKIRAVALRIQSTLTATVGDALSFVERPAQASFIREVVNKELNRLAEQCDQIVVVAHSQGAAVAFDALNDEAATKNAMWRATTGVGALVTFGAGINKLAALKVLKEGGPKVFGANPVHVVMLALLVVCGFFLWGYIQVLTGTETLARFGRALAIYAALYLVLGAITVAMTWLFSIPVSHRILGRNSERVKSWLMVPLMLGLTGAALVYADRSDVPLAWFALLFFPIVFASGALKSILSMEMKEAIATLIRLPENVATWLDVYAANDLVPNGETRPVNGSRAHNAESVRIYNRGSILTDHTTYWDNKDQFSLRVAGICAQVAGSNWRDRLLTPSKTRDVRSEWRVHVLRVQRFLTAVVWVIVFGLVWVRYAQHIMMPGGVREWVPASFYPTIRFVGLSVVFILARWITAPLFRKPWSRWTRVEQSDFRARILTGRGNLFGDKTPASPPNPSRIPVWMGIVVAAHFYLLYALIQKIPISSWITNPTESLGNLAGLVGVGWILSLYGRVRRAPPLPSDSP